MQHTIEAIVAFVLHPFVTITTLSLALVSKLLICVFLVGYGLTRKQHRIAFMLLIIFLCATACNDLEYIVATLLRGWYKLEGTITLNTFIARIDWVLYVQRFQALALFFEYLINRRIKLTWFWLANIAITGFLSLSFLYLAVGYYDVYPGSPTTLGWELGLIYASYTYALLISLWLIRYIFVSMNSGELPRILR